MFPYLVKFPSLEERPCVFHDLRRDPSVHVVTVCATVEIFHEVFDGVSIRECIVTIPFEVAETGPQEEPSKLFLQCGLDLHERSVVRVFPGIVSCASVYDI